MYVWFGLWFLVVIGLLCVCCLSLFFIIFILSFVLLFRQWVVLFFLVGVFFLIRIGRFSGCCCLLVMALFFCVGWIEF